MITKNPVLMSALNISEVIVNIAATISAVRIEIFLSASGLNLLNGWSLSFFTSKISFITYIALDRAQKTKNPKIAL